MITTTNSTTKRVFIRKRCGANFDGDSEISVGSCHLTFPNRHKGLRFTLFCLYLADLFLEFQTRRGGEKPREETLIQSRSDGAFFSRIFKHPRRTRSRAQTSRCVSREPSAEIDRVYCRSSSSAPRCALFREAPHMRGTWQRRLHIRCIRTKFSTNAFLPSYIIVFTERLLKLIPSFCHARALLSNFKVPASREMRFVEISACF